MTHYWISLRSVANGEFYVTPDNAPQSDNQNVTPEELASEAVYLKWDGDRPPVPADGSPRPADWVNAILAETGAIAAEASAQTRDIVFLVHGYNNSVRDTYNLHQRVQHELNVTNAYPCTVISFDWPSGNLPISYLDDRQTATMTALGLVTQGVRLFAAASRPDCRINVHIVAHSMGAFVVQTAMEEARHSNIPQGTWSVGQVALFAADIPSASLAANDSRSAGLYEFSGRVTNYFSGWDAALLVSNIKRIGLSPRAGRVGAPVDSPDMLVDVDCSDRYNRVQKTISDDMPKDATVSHSWYFYDPAVMTDLAIVLAGELDRNVIPGRKSTGQLNSFALLDRAPRPSRPA